jgi:hypothetical protein
MNSEQQDSKGQQVNRQSSEQQVNEQSSEQQIEEISEQVIKQLARWLTLGQVPEWREPFEKLWFTVFVSFLVVIIMLSLPPLVGLVTSAIFGHGGSTWLHTNRAWINPWLASLRLIFEILTAICIGGSIFARRRASKLELALTNYEEKLFEKGKAELTAREEHLIEQFRLIYRLASPKVIVKAIGIFQVFATRYRRSVQFFLSLLISYYTAIWVFKQMKRSWPVFTVLFASFPGGFYGLLAFIFLCSVCVCKLAQIYMAAVATI